MELAPDAAPRLAHLLPGNARRRATPVRFFWYDTPDFELAGNGLSLVERQLGRETVWRVERLLPHAGVAVPPGTPCPVLAEAADAASLGTALPASLTRMAGFEGQLRMLAAADGVQVAVLAGRLRAAAADFACCRMELAGPESAVAELGTLLAGRLPLHVPAESLGAAAMAVAGRTTKSRRHPPPVLPPDRPVGEAFALLVAQLATVILSEARRAGPVESEPVHQMRVAVRRLRSAAGLFSRAVHCPELTACKAELRALAKALGPTRDWDVFVAGAGRAVAANFAEDRAVQRLLVAAERRRLEAYAALQAHLDSPEFRRLGIALAVLATARPWEAVLEAIPLAGEDEAAAARQAERLAGPLDGFAARALERRLRPLREPGADIESLPPAALHGLRLHAKRLRYACEFFAPLFPGRGARRFIRRLGVLQERLGHLNDGAVAAGLMAEMGAARGYAGGVVRGFVAAQAAGTRFRIGRSWRKFHRLDPFWD